MEGYRQAFIQRGQKDSEKLVLQAVPDEAFLYRKINKIDFHVDYGSTEDILEAAYSLRLYGDLAALN